MLDELLVKIQNVAVRVAFAEDRDETENIAFKFVAFAIRVDESFGGEFRRGVKRSLYRERTIFRRGDDFRLAINAAGGAERDAPDAAHAHGFEDVEAGLRVLLKILARMVEAEAHVGIGGEVKNKIAAGHRLRERGQVETIAMDQLELRIFERAFKKFILPRGKIIVADDRFAVGKKPVNEVAADKTRRAGDENFFHDWAWSLMRAGGSCQYFCGGFQSGRA